MQIAEFIATIPQIQSAFNVGGDGSTRLKLDVPASEMAAIGDLITYGRDKALTITVSVDGEETT